MGILNCKYCGVAVVPTGFQSHPEWKHQGPSNGTPICRGETTTAHPRFAGKCDTDEIIKPEVYAKLFSDTVDKLTKSYISNLTSIVHAGDILTEITGIEELARRINTHIRETSKYIE